MMSLCILGFQETQQLTWAHFIHLLFTDVGELPGELQSICEANNSGLQTQQCPIRQVARNPCHGRFNTERTAI